MRQKLAPITDGPYPINKVDIKSKTFVIERPDRNVENLSYNRVVLAHKTKTKFDLMTAAQHLKLTEIVSEHSISEEDNLRDTDKDKKPSEDATDQEELTTNPLNDPTRGDEPPNGDTSQEEQPTMVDNQLPDDASSIQPTISRDGQLEEPGKKN